MSDENITWITVNGAHVPVKEGQDKGEAIREHFASKLKEEPADKETVREQMSIQKAAEEASKTPIQHEMTKDQMFEKVKSNIESVSGYSYSGKKLRQSIDEGLKDNLVIMSRGNMTLQIQGGEAVTKRGDEIVDRKKITPALADKLLMQYSDIQSRLSSGGGKF